MAVPGDKSIQRGDLPSQATLVADPKDVVIQGQPAFASPASAAGAGMVQGVQLVADAVRWTSAMAFDGTTKAMIHPVETYNYVNDTVQSFGGEINRAFNRLAAMFGGMSGGVAAGFVSCIILCAIGAPHLCACPILWGSFGSVLGYYANLDENFDNPATSFFKGIGVGAAGVTTIQTLYSASLYALSYAWALI